MHTQVYCCYCYFEQIYLLDLVERIGYQLQYSWDSLVAQMVKNLPVVQKIWVQSLGWEHFLEEGMAAHCSISAWRIPMDTGAWKAIIHGVRKSRT